MILKSSTYSVVEICLWCLICLSITSTSKAEGPERQAFNKPMLETTKQIEAVDEIVVKQIEMRDTSVLVQTKSSSGSGTIIDKVETEVDGVYEYRVLTNAHVAHSRFMRILLSVDFLTGIPKTEMRDTGCNIIIFDHSNNTWEFIPSKVIIENIEFDLAILSFLSVKKLMVAKIADKKMLENVRVFDDVFAIGCQLGMAPTPTKGIISQILRRIGGRQEWVIYGATSQIMPGSSGGGLFKKYREHYYLIGIPYRIAVTGNGQVVPHLAYVISISAAKKFIDDSSVTR